MHGLDDTYSSYKPIKHALVIHRHSTFDITSYGKCDDVTDLEKRLVSQMESNVKRQNAEMVAGQKDGHDTNSTSEATCEVRYGQNCFWTKLHPVQDMNVTAAQGICRKNRSELANIYGEDHFNLLLEHVRGKKSSRVALLWTGLTFNLSDNEVRLRNGSVASYVRWYPTFPRPWNDVTNIYIYVWNDPTLPQNAFVNRPMDFAVHGVVCERQSI